MSLLDSAKRYLDSIPPATEGGRNDALNRTAFAVLERFDLAESDFIALLSDWAAGFSPALEPSEVTKTLRSAWSGARAKGVIGSKARHSPPGHSRLPVLRNSPPMPVLKPARYALAANHKLPEPIKDGTRQLLRTVFRPGEGIRIAKAKLDDSDHEIPEGAGACLSREEWLTKLDRVDGSPNGIFTSSKRAGIYVGINPYRIGGSRDSDVTDFRHALIEFDEQLSPEAQFELYQQSRIPCAAVIYSGGKSVHAWVKIDAADSREYSDRVRSLYQHFQSAGFKLDEKNKNPGRLSRLPNCVRFAKRQELLALNIGCESFTEWLAEVQADGIGTVLTVDELDQFDPKADPNSVIGQRWLCKGGSCILVGPSGVGKSSLAVQFAVGWAAGRPVFGVVPVRPLKILFVQAENDIGDLAEMLDGVRKGLGIDPFTAEADYELVRKNLVFVRDTTHTGFAFCDAIRRLIDRHKPDLVMFDPLLSFIGADISRQEVCSEFLRSWLNPIAEATGVIWFAIHHMGKPSGDPKARRDWQDTDWAYAGIGSSELTNWARAVMTLRKAESVFRLSLSKRGKRAGATQLDGSPTTELWLRHAPDKIFWEQLEPPEDKPYEPKEHSKRSSTGKSGRPSKVQEIAAMNLFAVLSKCPPQGETATAIGKRLYDFCLENRKSLTEQTCRKNLVLALCDNGKLTADTKTGLFLKGPNA